ncbi:AAA family ATPase [Nocardia huaxiensis]|uniref:AAA family ATPase n=1 Tax=Nocardia huaxiensis TaxID=2755382 RepID=A0A7D6VBZ9_9NOCA|nr:BTAD domain-containing putative transcriptional regulator [Nocardia huaxiensis]QLY32752.1 AAA family ATPase [Nocardia huaxiensis]
MVLKWVRGTFGNMAVTLIGVLGPLHITIDGQRVPPGAPMQSAVLGRLVAAGGRVVTTDRLIDDLWNGDPPTKAVAALQVYIHNLRRVFEPDRPRRARSRVIVSESHGYALNLEPTQVDSWEFEQLLHGHEAIMRDPAGRPDPLKQVRVLDAALACWHGNAFESFTGMPWAAQESARLAALRLTAAELRAQAALEMNRPAEVVLALRPIFEEHPGREECVRLLALAQYRLGQSLEALATVRRSREFLTVEFGVDPGPGLRELETAILTHSVETDAPQPTVVVRPPEVAPTPEALPDNGYADQRRTILTAAEAAADGHVRLVWLSGEAGAGKSTLAAAIATHLSDRSWTVVFGRCPEVEGAPPAWAWAEVLTALDAAEPETFTAVDAFTLARRVVRSCRERSAAAPIAIVLEDVHGADTATLQVLRQVVNWLRDRPILIIVTLRDTEAGPGVRDTAAALAQFDTDRVELTGLDLAGTRSAAAAAGLTVLDDPTVELLRRRTGGNPLFVRELAKLVATQGTTNALPDSVRDLLGRRIAQLPADVTELLRQIAVWGEDTDLNTLRAATGRPADSIIDLVETAESARLLRTERSGRLAFDHALIRETVYYGIPTLRRARMHWAAFELLCTATVNAAPDTRDSAGTADGRTTGPLEPELVPGRDIDALAHHAALGADAETARLALEFVRAAARRCVERRMRADAVRRWRSVLALHELAGDTATGAPRADRVAVLEARCQLVTALAYDGQHLAARAERERALELARSLGGADLLARAATCWPTPLIWSVHDLQPGDPRIREPLRTALADPDLAVDARIRLHVTMLIDLAYEDPAGARAAAAAAAELAADIDDPELLCTVVNAQSFAAFATGGFLRSKEFQRHAERLLRIATTAGLTEFRALAHYLLFRSELAEARLVSAAEHARRAGEYAGDGQLRHLLDDIATFEMVLELLRGNISEAEQLLAAQPVILGEGLAGEDRIVETMRDPNALHFGISVSIAWQRGDMSVCLDELAARGAVHPELFNHAYALALVHAGRRAEARRVFAESPILGPPFEASFLMCWAKVALGLGDSARVRELYARLAVYSGDVGGLETGASVSGPVDAVLAELADAMGEPGRAADHRAAARTLEARLAADLEWLANERAGPRPETRPSAGA